MSLRNGQVQRQDSFSHRVPGRVSLAPPLPAACSRFRTLRASFSSPIKWRRQYHGHQYRVIISQGHDSHCCWHIWAQGLPGAGGPVRPGSVQQTCTSSPSPRTRAERCLGWDGAKAGTGQTSRGPRTCRRHAAAVSRPLGLRVPVMRPRPLDLSVSPGWCRSTSTHSLEGGTPSRSTGGLGATATWTCPSCI